MAHFIVENEAVQLAEDDISRSPVLQRQAEASREPVLLPLTMEDLRLWQHFFSLDDPCPAALAIVMQVSKYLGDAATLAASTASFDSLLLHPGHPAHSDAVAELHNLPETFGIHALSSTAATLGSLLEALPPPLHALVVRSHMKSRRFVDGLTFQRGTGPFGSLFAATVVHLNACSWLDLSSNRLGSPDSELPRRTNGCTSSRGVASGPIGGNGVLCTPKASRIATPDFAASCPFSPAFPGTPPRAPLLAIAPIATSFRQLTALHSLDLTDNALGSAGAVALGRHLPHLEHLQDLFLGSNALGSHGVAALAPHLAALTTLQLLDLSDNALDGGTAAPLAGALATLSLLRTLDVSGNALPGAAAAAFARALAPAAVLHCLFIGLNPLGREVAALAVPLATLLTLRDLDLSCAALGNKGACALAPALARLRALARLDLESNGLGPVAMAALVDAFAELPALAELTLTANPLRDGGAAALAAAAPRLRALRRLDIGHACIGYAGVAALAPALARITTLERLSLAGNASIGDMGVIVLGLCLGDCECLSEVDLSECGVHERSLVAAAATGDLQVTAGDGASGDRGGAPVSQSTMAAGQPGVLGGSAARRGGRTRQRRLSGGGDEHSANCSGNEGPWGGMDWLMSTVQ